MKAEAADLTTPPRKPLHPFHLQCHATLGEYDLVQINRRFSTLKAAKAVADTLQFCLSSKSFKLVKGRRWKITNQATGQTYSGVVRVSQTPY